MFDGLSPELDALLEAAKSGLPTAPADAGLLHAMASAVSADVTSPIPVLRRRSMLGKVLTAKAAAIAGVLVLTGGVASAATGTLPGPVQDTASHAVEHVGLHIPNSDDDTQGDSNDQGDDNGTDTTPTTVAHPDNHGNDVSTVAHDDSNEGADHGTAVCTVASDGKCQPNAGDDNNDQGNSGDHRQDGDHHTNGSTTTTEVNGDNGGQSGDDNSGDAPETEHTTPTTDASHHGSDDGGHHGSD